MAQDGEPSKSLDKGKGKATDAESSKVDEVKKDKNGKPIPNGSKEEPVVGGNTPAIDIPDDRLMKSSRGAQRGRSAAQIGARYACGTLDGTCNCTLA